MGRYEDLMKAISSQSDAPTAEDETTVKADSPRNALASAVNPLLDKYVNSNLGTSLAIPEQTVADDKRWGQDLPGQIGMATMGSIGKVDAPVSRFGEVFGPKETNFGKTILQPSAADLASDAVKAAGKPMVSEGVMKDLQAQYGDELAKRKSDMFKGLIPPGEYESFKQEMTDKFRPRPNG
jgi:hypothetical protein